MPRAIPIFTPLLPLSPVSAKKKKMADKILPQRVSGARGGARGEVRQPGGLVGISILAWPQIRELVPESQAYMDLLAFERKLDQTIMRKRLDIQEALKRPIKVRGVCGLSPGFGSS